MKYLFILFTSMVVSSSALTQVTIDFNELKKANSKNGFLKVCLSSGFEIITEEDNKLSLAYGYNDEFQTAQVWAYYYSSTESFYFIIYDVDYYDDNPQNGLYQQLTNEIKKCNYLKTFKHGFNYETDALTYLLYSCPSSTYKGKIGFNLKTENGMKVGRIRTFTTGEIEFYEYSPDED